MPSSKKNTQKLPSKSAKSLFTNTLMNWNKAYNDRKMPWKGEKDPYKIWLSEIILQQTRVEQGLAYYNRFVERYPTVVKLATAKDEEVYKMWEGLGYYTRCKNLIFTARYIAFELGGIFPNNYEELLQLKGVGPYTAAAIASFSYNLPYAVVDGNVFRVLARYFGIDEPTDTTLGKYFFTELANQLLSPKEAGLYNQAIMDFGAIICKPALPSCTTCKLHKTCAAIESGRVNVLPVKTKTINKKHRLFYYFIFNCNGKIGVIQRRNKDIWEGLYEFFLVESDKILEWNTVSVHQFLDNQLGIKKASIVSISNLRKQQLTHQQITGNFIRINLSVIPASLESLNWVSGSKFKQLAFPRFITAYFEENK